MSPFTGSEMSIVIQSPIDSTMLSANALVIPERLLLIHTYWTHHR